MQTQALVLSKPFGNNDLVETLQDAMSLGELVAKSGMFPDIQTQAQAVVKILAGRELGIPPMAAMRGIHVIKGKAEIGAGLFAAMIKASGKYDFRVAKSTDTECALLWFENDKPVGSSAFTIEDAKRAKLIKADSGWEKFPRAMCFARALTAGQKQFAPDVGIGAVYAHGEISESDFELEVIGDDQPEWVSPNEIRQIVDSNLSPAIKLAVDAAREEIAPTKDQIAEAQEKYQPPQEQNYDQKNRAHSADLGTELDAAIKRLTILKVSAAKIGNEIRAVVEREISGRVIKTRYHLNDVEASAVIQFLNVWADRIEKDSQAKQAEV